jgi:hypothetical protein
VVGHCKRKFYTNEHVSKYIFFAQGSGNVYSNLKKKDQDPNPSFSSLNQNFEEETEYVGPQPC